MKTTIELSDTLLSQAKAAARTQGISLKALIESGLRLAMHPKSVATKQVSWPDLTFHPESNQAGHRVAPSEWREAANFDGKQQGA